MGVGGHCHAPATFTPGKDPASIVQETGWAPGPVLTGAENLASTGIRSPDRPPRSESLYRLSYRGPQCNVGDAAYGNIKQLSNTSISVTQQPNLGRGRTIVDILDRQLSLLWTSDQLVVETSTYTTHN
jgi:hypothetical protein